MKRLFFLLAFFGISLTAIQAQINWMTWDEAIEANEKNPKKIFVDVYTDWCGWCKRMDATTFKDPEVIKALNEDFYAVKFDAEQQSKIDFKGKTYEFVKRGRRGSHELAQLLLQGRMGYPTVVFLDGNADVIQPVPGYQEAKAMAKIVKYFGEDAYQKMPWTEFAGE